MTRTLEEGLAAAAGTEATTGFARAASAATPATPDIEDVEFVETPRGQRPPDAGATPGPRSKNATAAQQRRIGLHHVAFFRGYLEGLNLGDLADRYLEFGRDQRKAGATQRWLLDELVAAARKRLDFGAARLLKIRPALIRPAVDDTGQGAGDQARPTLEEFAEAHDPDGFYTEKELLNLFAREYPGAADTADAANSRRQERNARLRKKQLAALAELERLLVEDPKLDHHVTGWFDTSVALRLADVGLHTLAHVIEAINSVGFRWYRSVPRLGEKGAARIVAFLDSNAEALGRRLSSGALTRPEVYGRRALLVRDPSTSIAPLEYYVPVPGLDGSTGENRDLASRNKTGALTDKDAILFWLRKYANKKTTVARYRSEAERLLLWANFQKNNALSSLTILDCHEYINGFLHEPGPMPAHMWVMDRAYDRWDPRWRPFRGPLAYKSRELALQALRSLCESLTRAHYLDFNPFSEVKLATLTLSGSKGDGEGEEGERKQSATRRVQIERSLTVDQWQFAMKYLARLPVDRLSTQRIRFILRFAYGTGLRRAELAAARTSHVVEVFAGADLGAIRVLKVLGKGNKERRIPLSPRILEFLGDYLESRGLPRDPLACPKGTPLIIALPDKRDIGLAAAARRVDALPLIPPGTEREKPITAGKLYAAVKRFFEKAASAAAIESPALGASFGSASTHWLRHTFGSHGVAHGMALETVRNFMGHESIATTSIYSTAEIARQFREVDAFLAETRCD